MLLMSTVDTSLHYIKEKKKHETLTCNPVVIHLAFCTCSSVTNAGSTALYLTQGGWGGDAVFARGVRVTVCNCAGKRVPRFFV